MAKIRQLVVMSDPATAKGQPLGTQREILRTLINYNIAPDGSPDTRSLAFGPGFIAQFPMSGDDRDEIKQFLVAINESDVAWPVLARLRRELGWAMMDPDSGKVFTQADAD